MAGECSSLEDVCIKKLTEKQKTLIVTNYSSYPVIADKILEPEKNQHKKLMKEIDSLKQSISVSGGVRKNPVTYLFSLFDRWYLFDRNTGDKAIKRRQKYRNENIEKWKNRIKSEQLSQQHTVQLDREIRKYEAQQDCDINFDLFD